MSLAALLTFIVIVGFAVGRVTATHKDKVDNRKLLEERDHILQDIKYKRAESQTLDKEYESKKKMIRDAGDSAQAAYDERVASLNAEYDRRIKECERLFADRYRMQDESYQAHKQQLADEASIIEHGLHSIKTTRARAMAAAKEDAKANKSQRQSHIQLSDSETHDVRRLESIMTELNFPEVLGKYIWTVFFQKKAKRLFMDVLGEDIVCGVYKITDMITNEPYVGQARNVKDRWQTHIKHGVGAISSTNTNQLYAAMRRDGAWNFSFELLEECEPQDLDDKERWYIDIYSADVIGLNAQKGNNNGRNVAKMM